MPKYLTTDEESLVRRLLALRRMLSIRGIARVSGVGKETVRLIAHHRDGYRPNEIPPEEIEFRVVQRHRCPACGYHTVYAPCVACAANTILDVLTSATQSDGPPAAASGQYPTGTTPVPV